jgi:hypothetical protein
MNNWTQEHLDNLGLKQDAYRKDKAKNPKPKVKIKKESAEKNTIDDFMAQLVREGIIKNYVKELRFDEFRKFRFDWAIEEYKVAIEYNGLAFKNAKGTTGKSGHQTVEGVTSDSIKANLAICQGWRILVYNAITYRSCYGDLVKLINFLKQKTQ